MDTIDPIGHSGRARPIWTVFMEPQSTRAIARINVYRADADDCDSFGHDSAQ